MKFLVTILSLVVLGFTAHADKSGRGGGMIIQDNGSYYLRQIAEEEISPELKAKMQTLGQQVIGRIAFIVNAQIISFSDIQEVQILANAVSSVLSTKETLALLETNPPQAVAPIVMRQALALFLSGKKITPPAAPAQEKPAPKKDEAKPEEKSIVL